MNTSVMPVLRVLSEIPLPSKGIFGLLYKWFQASYCWIQQWRIISSLACVDDFSFRLWPIFPAWSELLTHLVRFPRLAHSFQPQLLCSQCCVGNVALDADGPRIVSTLCVLPPNDPSQAVLGGVPLPRGHLTVRGLLKLTRKEKAGCGQLGARHAKRIAASGAAPENRSFFPFVKMLFVGNSVPGEESDVD